MQSKSVKGSDEQIRYQSGGCDMFLEAEWMIFHRKFLSIMQEGFRQPTCVPS